MFEAFLMEWNRMAADPRYEKISAPLHEGIAVIEKYHALTDRTEAHIVTMSKQYSPRLRW